MNPNYAIHGESSPTEQGPVMEPRLSADGQVNELPVIPTAVKVSKTPELTKVEKSEEKSKVPELVKVDTSEEKPKVPELVAIKKDRVITQKLVREPPVPVLTTTQINNLIEQREQDATSHATVINRGLIVRVASKTIPEGWDNSWIDAMDDYIHEIGEVIEIGARGALIDFKDGRGASNRFPVQSLEVVTPGAHIVEISNVRSFGGEVVSKELLVRAQPSGIVYSLFGVDLLTEEMELVEVLRNKKDAFDACVNHLPYVKRREESRSGSVLFAGELTRLRLGGSPVSLTDACVVIVMKGTLTRVSVPGVMPEKLSNGDEADFERRGISTRNVQMWVVVPTPVGTPLRIDLRRIVTDLINWI